MIVLDGGGGVVELVTPPKKSWVTEFFPPRKICLEEKDSVGNGEICIAYVSEHFRTTARYKNLVAKNSHFHNQTYCFSAPVMRMLVRGLPMFVP
jgi:hypothetical protein